MKQKNIKFAAVVLVAALIFWFFCAVNETQSQLPIFPVIEFSLPSWESR